ncbi:unnamed protein product, partial [Mesorhabditis spiculigera]
MAICEKCPPVWGEFECPLGFSCNQTQCLSARGNVEIDCAQLSCPPQTVCADGKCFPLSAIKCNRHVLTAEGEARSIVSDCGRRGKCVNGQCLLDRCADVNCEEGEICRDGKCTMMVEAFCVQHADCGPSLDCRNNKCVLRPQPPICTCNPDQLCKRGECLPNKRCGNIVCPDGSYCVEGTCITAVGLDCSDDVCHGGTVCVEGRCQADQCINRCPADHECREGQCRALQGILCTGECPMPYECVDGTCQRNECSLKVCQIGEVCEGVGSCNRAEGRFCTLAIRDCGFAFKCESNRCVDLLMATQRAYQYYQ